MMDAMYWVVGVLSTIVLALIGAWAVDLNKRVRELEQTLAEEKSKLASIETQIEYISTTVAAIAKKLNITNGNS